MKPFLNALAALVLLACAPLAQAAVFTATPTTLNAVKLAAQKGDTVALGPYTYVNPIFKAGAMPDGLTVDATGATITNAKVYGATNLTIIGGTWNHGCVVGGTVTSCSGAAGLWVESASGFTLKGAKFTGTGAPEGYGVKMLNVTGFTITDSGFSGLRTGIPVDGSRDGVIRNVTFEGMGSDGVALGWSRNILIEKIDCRKGVPVVGAHPDCVQGYSRATYAPTSDIIIRGMLATGDTDGALFSNKGSRLYPIGTKTLDGTVLTVATYLNDGGFDRITIEDSTATVSQANGASFNFCRDCTMRNVKVSTATNSTIGARFYISPDSTMRERCGNSYAAWMNMAGVSDPPCPPALTADQIVIADLKAQLATTQAALTAANQNLAAANDNLATTNQALLDARATIETLKLRMSAIAAMAAPDAPAP